MATAKPVWSDEHGNGLAALVKDNGLVEKFQAHGEKAKSPGKGPRLLGKNAQNLVRDNWDKKILVDIKLDWSSFKDIVHAKCKTAHPNYEVDKEFCKLYIHHMATELAKRALKLKGTEKPSEADILKYAKILSEAEIKPPKTSGTGQSKTGGVDRLTDSSKYTGAHKERFAADGKGKGLAGRENLTDNSGYVGNYKGEGSYKK